MKHINKNILDKETLNIITNEFRKIIDDTIAIIKENFDIHSIYYHFDLQNDIQHQDNELIVNQSFFSSNLNFFDFNLYITTKDLDQIENLRTYLLNIKILNLAKINLNNEIVDIKKEILEYIKTTLDKDMHLNIFTALENYNIKSIIDENLPLIIISFEMSVLNINRTQKIIDNIEKLEGKYGPYIKICRYPFAIVLKSDLEENYSTQEIKEIYNKRRKNSNAIMFKDLINIPLGVKLNQEINTIVSFENKGFFINWLK